MIKLVDAIPNEQLHQAHILIVDDNSTNVLLLEGVLEEEGFENVESVTDPRKVTDLVASESFDLILLDINMPYLDGFAVMEQLWNIEGANYLPILVLTAQKDQETRLRALECGAMDFVSKPFNYAEVLNRINNLLTVRLLHTQAEELSSQLARYLPSQVAESISKGNHDLSLGTKRKKLTILFSDIVGFTEITDDLEPEDLNSLLNEYLCEMSAVASAHGGTLDKFIGDAILIFFGDPDSKGVQEDAIAAVNTALAMQEEMDVLSKKWANQGFEKSFKLRIGLNTGYCNVGNFGTPERMDYTIIGGEVNLASRVEGLAKPGKIMMTYETYALVQGIIDAEAAPPVMVKGIRREIRPYSVVAARNAYSRSTKTLEKKEGFLLEVDSERLQGQDRQDALATLRALIRDLEE